MKRNVLVAGIGQVNYLFQLYGNIGPKLNSFNFNSLNLQKFGDEDTALKSKEIFCNNYQFKFNYRNGWMLIEGILNTVSRKHFWLTQRIMLAENGWRSFRYFFGMLKQHIAAYHLAKFIDGKTNTEIIHVHYPKYNYILFLKYLKNDYKVIQTFWGSDIYRINSWIDHEIQQSTLPKSDFITVTTPEMRFCLLTRYGDSFFDRIRLTKFVSDDTYYTLAGKLLNDFTWQETFKSKLGISENKIIILFGHNAHKPNNHLKLLEELRKLPSNILADYHIIFPLAYGDPSGRYINELKNQSENIPATFTFLTNFMNWEEMAKLKIVSDVYIHGPTTDGLSAYLTEFLFTENLAIVGDWLPYKTFSDAGIRYLEFSNFSMLNKLLLRLRQEIAVNATNVKGNRAKVLKYFNNSTIVDEWVSFFNEIPVDL